MSFADDAATPAVRCLAWVARQPILTREGRTFGYELLYRDGPENRAAFESSSHASASTFLSAFADIGQKQLCGSDHAFVHLPISLLMSEAVEAIPPRRLVLQLGRLTVVDGRLIGRLDGLRSRGYQFAAELSSRPDPALAPLLARCAFLEVDAHTTTPEQAEALLQHRGSAQMIVKKVETHATHARYLALGFDLFRGHFYRAPEVVSGAKPCGQAMRALQLLAKVRDPSVSLVDLAALISTDPALSYRLLKMLGSAAFARPFRIDSIKRAVVMLGRERVTSFVTLLTFLETGSHPAALHEEVLVRARMCERIAETLGRFPTDPYFSVGLLSVLDVMLGQSITEAIRSIPLTEEVERALVTHRGPMGEVLRLALDYQSGEWRRLDLGLLPAEVIADIYFEAVGWARALYADLGA